jgi:molecular chaperone GrpE
MKKSEEHDKNEGSHKNQETPPPLPPEGGEVNKKAEEYDVLWDKYLRICAEFENARRRWEREKVDIVKFAHSGLIRELVVVIDELEHALRAIQQHSGNKEIGRGVELIYNNLLSLLKKEGLVRIEAKGKKFDPHLHEIVGYREVDELEEHLVLEEVQTGYLLGEKVLRTAKVIVGVRGQAEDRDSEKQNKENEKDQDIQSDV